MNRNPSVHSGPRPLLPVPHPARRPEPSSTPGATRLSTLLLPLLLILAAVLMPSPALCGANETPGQSYRPHAFGYYSANQWQFGAVDVRIFQFYVVGHQHYRQGAAYVDAANDYSSGGAGIWNFFTFCTNRAHDVMLVTSHGSSTPTTIVEQYPNTPRGRAVRDSVLAWYNGIFAAGSFVAGDYGIGHTIDATQTFYTTYFQTPKAFCWWATCWSALLNMTGPAEARDYLGYDASVFNSKCYCDERTILRRMDGQEGQMKRPLAAAFATINADCPPGGANLVHKGAGNTVLSPSVIVNEPTGIVCEPTPGRVKFDCTMDLTVPPPAVVVAYGDGYLTNHRWVGDDEVDYDVIPITPAPTILYDVIESAARSQADRARLDGNTNPPGNAIGPNQDDFIWITTCPYWYWIYCPDLVTVPDPSPGIDVNVYSPLTNNTDSAMNLTATFSVAGIQIPVTSQTLTLPPRASQTLVWPVPVPQDAVEGQAYPMNLTVVESGNPYTVTGQLVVGTRLRAELVRPVTLGAGMMNQVDVSLENLTGAGLDVGGAHLTDEAGWVVPGPSTNVHLEPGATTTLSFQVSVPPSTPPGTSDSFTLGCTVGSDVLNLPLGSAVVGLPLSVRRLDPVDVVPGNTNAALPIELVSLSLTSVNVTYQAVDSHGFPVTVQAPSVLPPQGTVTGSLVFPIPVDPSLVGSEGLIHLTIRDSGGYLLETDLGYTIEPAIEVIAASQSLFTGWSTTHAFPWLVSLRNRADVPQAGQVFVGGAVPVSPSVMPFSLPANGTAALSPQFMLAPDSPPGPFQEFVQVQTQSHIGDRSIIVGHSVTTPVTVDPVVRAWSGAEGELLNIPFFLYNRRPDHAMSGTWSVTDERGWVTGPPSGSYTLAPGHGDTVHVAVQLPAPRTEGQLDSSLVTIQVQMTFDTGLPWQATASVEVVLLPGTSGAPAPEASGTSALLDASPNPFGGSTRIDFRLARNEHARLTVHDALGRRVATLTDGMLPAGRQALRWDGRNDQGETVPDGIYFLRLETPESSCVRKAVRMQR